MTRGEIVLLSDANPMYRPDAARRLVRHFADPTVGAVSGDVRLVDAGGPHAPSEGLYYRYERWLQSAESRVGSIIGADGAMYALRRELFRPPPDCVILDDFVISMNVARAGFRVLYEPAAIALEAGTATAAEEFRRKVRIVAGGVQALRLGEGVPGLRQPVLLASYVSHKLLRWLVPVFAIAAFAASAVLASEVWYRIALVAQVGFYGSAAAYAMGVRRLRWAALPYYFSLVNGAALVGLRGISGGQTVTWARTRRPGERPEAHSPAQRPTW
jgi:cellulose synthase/poly-beta-1,6-N-acetylglucosamine synthase-like glycosyltransferase